MMYPMDSQHILNWVVYTMGCSKHTSWKVKRYTIVGSQNVRNGIMLTIMRSQNVRNGIMFTIMRSHNVRNGIMFTIMRSQNIPNRKTNIQQLRSSKCTNLYNQNSPNIYVEMKQN